MKLCGLCVSLMMTGLGWSEVGAQGAADSVNVRGTVLDSVTGATIAMPRLRVSGLQDSIVASNEGSFAFRAPLATPITLITGAVGYQARTMSIAPRSDTVLTVRLVRQIVALAPVRATAGLYSVGGDRTAALTALQVATTPGAANDIARAIQTLPGVQTVDEGSGLFVRGGDPSETRVLLNGVPILNPLRFETPIGSASPSVNPFLLRSIAFSSGGFGSRFGNALSGIVDLATLGRPSTRSVAVNAGLTFGSIGIGLPLGKTTGVRLNGSRYSTAVSNDINGSVRSYETAPNGSDVTGQFTWAYRQGGEASLFGIRQTNQFSVETEDAAFRGLYSNAQRTGSVILAWRDAFGIFQPAVSVGRSSVRRDEESGALDIGTSQSITAAAADVRVRLGAINFMRLGLELERDRGELAGAVPLYPYRRNEGDPLRLLDGDASIDRLGGFLEGSWQVGPRLRLGPSVRFDQSRSFAERTTLDPRLSIAYRMNDELSLTAAAGGYSQRPDALSLARGAPAAPSVPHARHFIVGAQRETNSLLIRGELFDKRYRHLHQFNRQRQPVYDGIGTSRGADGFVRWVGRAGLSARGTLSLLRARRTDPDASTLERAPNDISHSIASIVEKSWQAGWRITLAYRNARGRPYTPVVGASQQDATDPLAPRIWVPQYGESFSAELPALRRLDGSLSFRRPFGRASQVVYTMSMTNLLDRHNVSGIRYDADYSDVTPIRSPVKRMIYVGFSLTYLQ